MTALAILSAIIVVLTLFCSAVRIGPAEITLALAPIVVGAALFGPLAGLLLGAVMGITVFLSGYLSGSWLIITLMEENPFWCVTICVLKSAVAGYLAGLVYSLFGKRDKSLTGVVLAGIVCPLVNTGIFLLGMFIFFDETLALLAQMTGNENVVAYAIFGLAGINFLIELIVNLVLSTGIERIIKAVKK